MVAHAAIAVSTSPLRRRKCSLPADTFDTALIVTAIYFIGNLQTITEAGGCVHPGNSLGHQIHRRRLCSLRATCEERDDGILSGCEFISTDELIDELEGGDTGFEFVRRSTSGRRNRRYDDQTRAARSSFVVKAIQ